MKDTNMDKSNPLPEKSKGRNKKIKIQDSMPIEIPETDLTSPSFASSELKKTIENIIQNSANRYTDIADKQLKETRDDFDALQPIISEFLDEFILIGHTLDGNRVVMRYTSTQADRDKLSELCKKVLIRMLTQEQSGN